MWPVVKLHLRKLFVDELEFPLEIQWTACAFARIAMAREVPGQHPAGRVP